MRRSILLTCLAACSLLLAKAQVKPQRIRVSSGVAQGLLVSKVEPEYPPLAHPASLQGTVILKIVISKSGDVESAELVSGHPVLAPAAIEAVKKWKYRPYLLNGEAIAMETQVIINFALTHDPPEQANPTQSAPGGPPTEPSGIVGSAPPGTPLPEPPQRVRVSSAVQGNLIVKKVAPLYPEDARRERVQGTVLLKAVIDKQGNVDSLDLISGHPMLAPAAIEAVRQWKYKPYLLNETPVEVETQIQVNFLLTKK